MTAPKIVTVTFAGDSMTADLQSFGRSVASSSWWNDVRTDYCSTVGDTCMGAGPSGTSVVLSTAPATSYTDSDRGGASTLQSWLSDTIAKGALPKPSANTLYVVYFPKTTTITLDGLQSCTDSGFDGYHNVMSTGDGSVFYAVVVECDAIAPPYSGVAATSLLANTTITASHEIFETASDPNPPTGYALNEGDEANWAWIDLAGEEGADLCQDPFGLNQDQTKSGSFTVQRIWSNSQAHSGKDPCRPIPSSEVYFNAASKQSFFIVGVGESATFEVDAFSSGSRDDWSLTAQDWSQSMTTSYLSFSIAGSENAGMTPVIQVNNGSRAQVTVKLLREPGKLETGEADGAIISFSGDPKSPTAAHWWPLAVMSSADAADAGISVDMGARHRSPYVHPRRRTQRAILPALQVRTR